MQRQVGCFSLKLFPAAPYCARDGGSENILGVALQPQSGAHAIGTDRRTDFETWPGTVSFKPPGLDVFSESDRGGEYISVGWLGDSWTQEAPTNGRDPSRPQWRGQRRVLRAAFRLRAALLREAADPELETGISSLLAACDSLGQPSRTNSPPAQRYRRVMECIADELCDPDVDLSLERLSHLAGEAPLAFLRGFSRAFGITPHAYVADQRLQVARRLIAHTELSLAAIAAETNYASQSHMGASFRSGLGMTPGRYRCLHRTEADAEISRGAASPT